MGTTNSPKFILPNAFYPATRQSFPLYGILSLAGYIHVYACTNNIVINNVCWNRNHSIKDSMIN